MIAHTLKVLPDVPSMRPYETAVCCRARRTHLPVHLLVPGRPCSPARHCDPRTRSVHRRPAGYGAGYLWRQRPVSNGDAYKCRYESKPDHKLQCLWRVSLFEPSPGNYEVTAGAPGFGPTGTNFTLSTDETRNVPITLTVGSVATQVQVTSQQPVLDTSDTRNQLTIDRAALATLPMAARNPLALITLTPGVTGIGAGNATNFNPENSVDASANGRGSNGTCSSSMGLT